jgi:DNA-binding response OmpR family regulator
MGANETESPKDGQVPLSLDNENPSPRVLVVDDDLHVRELIETYLLRAAFRVDTVADGAAAWDALNVASYHLLITDHQMPKLTGLQLIKKLRSENMTLPVILVSGTIPQEEIRRHPELAIVATLPKPFSAKELLDTVQKVLNPSQRPPLADLVKLQPESETAEISQTKTPALATIPDQVTPAYRILVVDDDPDVRQLTMDVLVAANYCVEGVKDGAVAWDAVQTDNNFDLIITDNHMPKMTGVELIEKLHSAHLKPRVIMATGNLPTHEFARKPWLKPDATLQRPFTIDDLLEAVRSVLRTDNGNGEEKVPLNPA